MSAEEMDLMALDGVVLLPGCVVGLNIFEPRYRELLNAALQADRTYGICHVQDGKPAAYFGMGLIKCSIQNPDGTYQLILEGLERYQIKEILSVDPVLRVRCVKIDGKKQDTESDPILRAHAENAVQDLLKNSSATYLDDQLFPPNLSDADFCDLVAGQIFEKAVWKQKILETVAVEKRLTVVLHFLNILRRNRR